MRGRRVWLVRLLSKPSGGGRRVSAARSVRYSVDLEARVDGGVGVVICGIDTSVESWESVVKCLGRSASSYR